MIINFKGSARTGKTYKINELVASLLKQSQKDITVLWIDVDNLGEHSIQSLVEILGDSAKLNILRILRAGNALTSNKEFNIAIDHRVYFIWHKIIITRPNGSFEDEIYGLAPDIVVLDNVNHDNVSDNVLSVVFDYGNSKHIVITSGNIPSNYNADLELDLGNIPKNNVVKIYD